jgi:hypothetical protein
LIVVGGVLIAMSSLSLFFPIFEFIFLASAILYLKSETLARLSST